MGEDRRFIEVMINDTTKKIIAALTKKYAPPAYGFLTEVRNGTGYQRSTRTCDGLAMSLYPGRGLELIGFEIKTLRSDWVKELKDPSKSEDFINFCDRWYLVISDVSIVQTGELPPTWGLMVLSGNQLKVVTPAPKLTPQPLDRLFLASLFRDFTETTVPAVAVEQLVKDKTASLLESEKERWKRDSDSDSFFLKRDFERSEKAIKEFEEKSGVTFNPWGMGAIGKAVKIALEAERLSFIEQRLKRLRDNAKEIYEDINKVIGETESI